MDILDKLLKVDCNEEQLSPEDKEEWEEYKAELRELNRRCSNCGEIVARGKELCADCEADEIQGMEYGN